MQILDVIGCRETSGEIGVEIEMEAHKLPTPDLVQTYWRVEQDPSLRGESCEFVLRKPLDKDDLSKALLELDGALKTSKTEVKNTYRAGIHIHINVQDLTPRQLITFISLYFMLEEVFLSFCDKSRAGNHFCLRLSDASYTLDAITQAVLDGNFKSLNTEDLRYASLNVTSLFKYGSIEFRALESMTDFEKIKIWALSLLRLKDFVKTVNKPTDILNQASERGFTNFSKDVFGEFYKHFAQFITEDQIRKGVRNIQYAVYSRDWDAGNLNIFDKNISLFSS